LPWQYAPLCDCPYFCFEEDYQAIAQHLQDRSVRPTTITDIGCAFGAQNLYFPDWQYVGIDRHHPEGCLGALGTDPIETIPFFREGESGVRYVLGTFPDVPIKWDTDVFISNMSVGYPVYSDTTTDLATAFRQFQCGYFKGPAAILDVLKQVFPHCERVQDGRVMAPAALTLDLNAPLVEHDFSLYFLSQSV